MSNRGGPVRKFSWRLLLDGVAVAVPHCPIPRRSLLGYRHAVVCDDWEDAPRARFDSLSYSLLAPGADAMSAAHETHLTRLWDHLGSWFAIEDRV